jgi:hypothetical protein
MTFTAITATIADRLNLTSAAAITRVGGFVNERYREVCSGIGLVGSVRTTTSATATVGSRYLTFTCEKVFNVYDQFGRAVTSITRVLQVATITTPFAHGYQTGTVVTIAGALQAEYNGNFAITVLSTTTFSIIVTGSPATPATGTITVETQVIQRILKERAFDEIRFSPLQFDPPLNWAVQNMGASTVTIFLDCAPATAYILNADVEMNITDLSGSNVPAFSQDFHDILVRGGLSDELYKMEKYAMAKEQETKFEKRLGELRLFIAKSGGLDVFQGKMAVNMFPGIGRLVP